MSEMPRLIWTSDPDALAGGEISIEIKLRREMATIVFMEAAKRAQRPVDFLADIVESVLQMIDLPCDSACDEQADILMEKLWG